MIDDETTVQINGGPKVPLSEFTAAAERLTSNTPAVAADQLRLFIERAERLMEEKKEMADDIKDVFAEAKANGYDTKTMRLIIRLRKMDTHTRQEMVALLETYATALGIQGMLPL